jgi:peroxiredoxin
MPPTSRFVMFLAACVALGSMALAQDPGPPPPPPPPAETPPADPYLALLAEFEAAVDAHKQAIREERDPAKRRALRGETAEKQLLPEFEALVAGGDGRGLMWIARHVGAAGLEPEVARKRRSEAWHSLAHDQLTAPWVGEAIDLIRRMRADIGRDTAIGYLEHMHTEAQDNEVKAAAADALVQVFSSSEAEPELARKRALEELLAGEYSATAFVRAQVVAAAAREAATRPGAIEVDSEGRPVEAPKPAPIEPGVPIGLFAPPLDGLDARGAPRSLADVSGKVTVVVFFGFWSPPARKALLDLRELERELADPRVAVYGVSAGDSRTSAQEWIKKLGLTWPIVVQGLTDSPLSERWRVTDYPETWVLDTKGRVAGRAQGLEVRALVLRELGKLGG